MAPTIRSSKRNPKTFHKASAPQQATAANRQKFNIPSQTAETLSVSRSKEFEKRIPASRETIKAALRVKGTIHDPVRAGFPQK
jgi:hypothetical protein